ncbi:MAG: signal peptidase I [Oscillospiraceae bacterium]|nr:signal peptidase I [Oscillospiraceae bacterium]
MLFFRVVVVEGDSMKSTLLDGDRLLLLSNVVYQEPQQGDIIVARKNSFRGGECVVKRVIATEGQTVAIDDGIVVVNGVELDEPYLREGLLTDIKSNSVTFPLVVGEGQVFVLGDNRGASLDSRSRELGLIDERQILGKAIFLMMPGNDGGHQQPDYNRVGVVN